MMDHLHVITHVVFSSKQEAEKQSKFCSANGTQEDTASLSSVKRLIRSALCDRTESSVS